MVGPLGNPPCLNWKPKNNNNNGLHGLDWRVFFDLSILLLFLTFFLKGTKYKRKLKLDNYIASPMFRVMFHANVFLLLQHLLGNSRFWFLCMSIIHHYKLAFRFCWQGSKHNLLWTRDTFLNYLNSLRSCHALKKLRPICSRGISHMSI
jgi:hypothetical protein